MDKNSAHSFLEPQKKVLVEDSVKSLPLQMLLDSDLAELSRKNRKNKNKIRRINILKKRHRRNRNNSSETSSLVHDTRGPVEKTGPYSDESHMQFDIPDSMPSIPRRLTEKQTHIYSDKMKNKLYSISQKDSDYISQIENSCVYIKANLQNNVILNGAGFFISKNHIVTCAHVGVPNIYQTKNKNDNTLINLQIKFNDEYYPVKVVLYSINLDFSVLYFDSGAYNLSDQIYPINLGNSNDVKKGDSVYVLGFPLNFQTITVQKGIISNIDNEYFMYTDTEILPGDSGGPIYDIEKQAVIGIAAATLESGKYYLGEFLKIDILKNYLKQHDIPFIYKELNKKANSEIQGLQNSVYQDRMSGYPVSGKGSTRERGKGRKDSVHTMVPHGVQTSNPFQSHHTIRHSSPKGDSSQESPFKDTEPLVYREKIIKKRDKKVFDPQKGYWVFNIPLGKSNSSKYLDLQIYKKDKDNDDHYLAYYKNKLIMSSIRSDENKNPLLNLVLTLKGKFNFDTTYYTDMEEYTPYLGS